MTTRTLVSKVAGVTYEGRQDIIAKLSGAEPCRIVPEPDNKYDPSALAVHVATRVASLGGAGEVMVSATSAALLEGSGLSLADAGEHELKGVEGRRRIYRLVD